MALTTYSCNTTLKFILRAQYPIWARNKIIQILNFKKSKNCQKWLILSKQVFFSFISVKRKEITFKYYTVHVSPYLDIIHYNCAKFYTTTWIKKLFDKNHYFWQLFLKFKICIILVRGQLGYWNYKINFTMVISLQAANARYPCKVVLKIYCIVPQKHAIFDIFRNPARLTKLK